MKPKLVQFKYNFGPHDLRSHIRTVIRENLTRDLAGLYGSMIGEMATAYTDVFKDVKVGGAFRFFLSSSSFVSLIPSSFVKWTKVHAISSVMQVVCCTSNRMLVGQPLCRDPIWVRNNIKHTMNVREAARKINHYLMFLWP